MRLLPWKLDFCCLFLFKKPLATFYLCFGVAVARYFLAALRCNVLMSEPGADQHHSAFDQWPWIIVAARYFLGALKGPDARARSWPASLCLLQTNIWQGLTKAGVRHWNMSRAGTGAQRVTWHGSWQHWGHTTFALTPTLNTQISGKYLNLCLPHTEIVLLHSASDHGLGS